MPFRANSGTNASGFFGQKVAAGRGLLSRHKLIPRKSKLLERPTQGAVLQVLASPIRDGRTLIRFRIDPFSVRTPGFITDLIAAKLL